MNKTTESNVFRVTGWHKTYQTAAYGEGIYLYDTDGKRYLDGIAGTHVNTIGHGVEAIGEAMAEQARKVAFVHKALFTSEPQEALASVIAQLAPEGMNRVSFATGGSTANEMAIQMAQYYQVEKGRHQGRKIIARWHSYHGRTIATLSLSGNMFVRRNMPLSTMDFPHIAAPTCYHCPFGKQYPTCELACANALATTIEQEGPDSVAAFIAEPIIGGAGSAVVPPPGYYERIREICDFYDILFIAEEVITGFGRTGTLFAMEQMGVAPDLTTFAKSIAGGFPLAGVTGRAEVMDAVAPGGLGGTYAGNPIACVAALEVLKVFEQENLLQKANDLGQKLKDGLLAIAEKHPEIGDVRGLGAMIAIELFEDGDHSKPDAKLTAEIVARARDKGLILLSCGPYNNVLRILVPLTIEDAQIRQGLEIISQCFAEAKL